MIAEMGAPGKDLVRSLVGGARMGRRSIIVAGLFVLSFAASGCAHIAIGLGVGLAVGLGSTIGGAAAQGVSDSRPLHDPVLGTPAAVSSDECVMSVATTATLVPLLPPGSPGDRSPVIALSHDGIALATAHANASDGVQVRLWDLTSRPTTGAST